MVWGEIDRVMIRLVFASLFFVLLAPVENQHTVYLPIVRTDIQRTGGAGVFHAEDCGGLDMHIGQNWITRRAYVPECAQFIPNISCTIRRYGDYRNGELQLARASQDLPPDYSGYLLFLNEPLYKGQCNIDPYNAALLYWQTVEQYPNACISSPNFSHLAILKYGDLIDGYIREIERQAPDGATWGGFCFWAVHNYHADNPALIYELLTEKMQEWGDGTKLIWVTEYGVTKPDDVRPMIKATLCNDQIVTAWWWSPYSDDPTALRNKDGLTPVGVAYSQVMAEYKNGILCSGGSMVQ